jgi:hypothetical protein
MMITVSVNKEVQASLCENLMGLRRECVYLTLMNNIKLCFAINYNYVIPF